jgi:hypothetical protein
MTCFAVQTRFSWRALDGDFLGGPGTPVGPAVEDRDEGSADEGDQGGGNASGSPAAAAGTDVAVDAGDGADGSPGSLSKSESEGCTIM